MKLLLKNIIFSGIVELFIYVIRIAFMAHVFFDK